MNFSVDPAYLEQMLKNLNAVRNRSRYDLLNIQIVGEDPNSKLNCKAHKVILASSSHYFNSKIEQEESKNPNRCLITLKLDFNGLETADFPKILDYMYSGKIECTTTNAISLYNYSIKYQLVSLQAVIIDFMKNNITRDTWLKYWRFSRTEKNVILEESCDKYCEKAYNDLFNLEALKAIKLEELITIVQILRKKWKEEHSEVFGMITAWLLNNECDIGQAQGQALFKLTECSVLLKVDSMLYLHREREALRRYLENLTKTKLEEICTHPNIISSQQVLLECIIEWATLSTTNRKECTSLFELIDYQDIDPQTLKINKTCQEHVEIKEIIEKKMKIASQLANEPDSVKNNAKLNMAKRLHKLNDIKNQDVYIVSNDGMLKYDRTDNSVKCTLSFEAKNGFAAIPMKDDSNILISDSDSFSRYSRELNEIKKLTPMEESRIYHNMIEFGDDIYACGGVNSTTVEVYNVKRNTWEILTSEMKYQRDSFKMAEYENSIYMFGGYDHSLLLPPGIERYDPREGKWIAIERSEIPDMKFILKTFSTSFLCNGSIYTYYQELANATSAATPNFKAKKFDIKAEKWIKDGLHIPTEFKNCQKFEVIACTNGPVYITTVDKSQKAEVFKFKPQTESWEKDQDFVIYNYPQECSANLIRFPA